MPEKTTINIFASLPLSTSTTLFYYYASSESENIGGLTFTAQLTGGSGGGGSKYQVTTSSNLLEEGDTITVSEDGLLTYMLSTTTGMYGTRYGTITVTSGTESVTIKVNIDRYVLCLTGDTLITMADRTQKRIDQVKPGDYVLSIDPATGKFTASYVYYSDYNLNFTHTHYDRFEFEDGTVLTVVHRHRFYNMERHQMIHLDSFKLGQHCHKLDGSNVALTDAKFHYEDKTVNHYTIFCTLNNYFANGLLCGNRFTERLPL